MSSYLMHRKKREEEERRNPTPTKRQQTAEAVYGMPEGADLTRHLQAAGKLPAPTTRPVQSTYSTGTAAKGQGNLPLAAKTAAEALQRIASNAQAPTKTKSTTQSRATDNHNRLKQAEQYKASLQTRIYAPTEADQKRIDQIGAEAWRQDLIRQAETLDTRIKGMRLQQAHDIANAAKESKGYNAPEYRQSVQRQQDAAKQKADRQSEIDRLQREYTEKSQQYYASRSAGGYDWIDTPQQKQMLQELAGLQEQITKAKGTIEHNKMEIDSGWDRWVELASKTGQLTEAEQREAKEAAKLLRKYQIGKEGNLDRQALAAMLENRSNSGSSAMAGFVSAIPGAEHLLNRAGITASQSAAQAVKDEALASALRQNDPNQDIQSANPKANLLGRIAGDVAVTAGVGKAVKGVTEANKVFGKLAPWVRHIIQSAGTFGATEAMQSAGNMQTPGEWNAAEQQKAEAAQAAGQTYEPQEYSLAGQLLNVGKRAGTAALGGAAGGAAGYGVGKATGTLLQKAGLQVPFMEAVRQTISGTAAAAANTGTTYALTPEDQRPSKEQVIQDVAVAFIFSAITSSVDTYKATQANKQALDEIVARMQQEYGKTLSAAKTPEAQAAALESVENLTARARQLLAGNYLAGQQKYVNNILDGLDAMDEQVALARQRMGAPKGIGSNSGLPVQATPPQPIPQAPVPRPIPYAPGSPEEAAHQARQTAIDGEPGSGYTENKIVEMGENLDGEGALGIQTVDQGDKGDRRGPSTTYTRTTEEKGTFLERAKREKRETREIGQFAYAYKRTPQKLQGENAVATMNEMHRWGITDVVIIDDAPQANDGTTTTISNGEATTLSNGTILLQNKARLQPLEIAGHEGFHHKIKIGDDTAKRYLDTVQDNVDFSKGDALEYASILADAYFGENFDITEDYDELYSELAGYLSGRLNLDANEAITRFGNWFRNADEVIDSWMQMQPRDQGSQYHIESAYSQTAEASMKMGIEDANYATGDDPRRAGAIQEGNERIPGPEGSRDAAEAGSGVLDTADPPQYAGRTAAGTDAGGGAGTLQNGAEVGRISENPQRAPQESAGDAGSQLTRKGETYLKRAQRRTVDALAAAMDVPEGRQRDTLLPLVDEITQELQRTGHLSQETADAAFEKIYGAGVKVLAEFYDEHRDLQQELRASRLQLAEQGRADIADFEAFRRSNQGRLTIVRQDGIPVDVKYMELASRYPDLFPAEITHPADQLQRIAAVQKRIAKTEMSLDQYHGADAERYKKFARYEYDQAIEKLAEEVGYVQRYENDRQSKNQRVEMPDADLDAIRQAYARNAQLQKESQKVMAKHLLTEADSRQVDRLLGGEITPEELPSGANREGILAVYKAKKAQQDNMAIVRQYRGQLKEARQQRALELVENADAWQDKKMGFAYSRETAERNIQDIMGKEDAARINAEYFQPVHQAEAESVRLQNRLRDQIRDLHISQKLQYPIIYKDPATGEPRMTKASESTLVQLLGEKVITPKAVQACGADVNKIQNAVDVFRKTYNTLFKLANDSLIRNGYAPVEYRQDYFPHFQDNKPDSVLAKIAYTLGMKVEDNKLPTDIAGMTHTFKPGKKWMGHLLRREGQATTYDALAGFDRYLNGAADVIFHTDNIQGLRSLESALRYKFSDEGTQAEIDAIRTRKDIDEFTREAMLEGVYERDRSNLPNLVTWLRNYTDLLAGKKHPSDRSTEHELGRKIYDVSKALEGRVAANMVALNPGSWLTNFIPLTQGASQVKTWSMLKAMKDSLVNEFRDDGFVDASDFLTNRRGVDPLVKGTAEKMSETLSKPMFYIDDFTANTLVRARYSENINNGMEPAAAMQDADAWTAGIMADRSKGATPTLFNKRNPLAKTVTMFQLEVNNQLSYIFKDLPREEKQKGCLAIAAALLKMFVGSYLYNEVYEKLTGRRSALDPIDIIKSAVEDFADDDTRASEAMGNLVENVADQVPFVGGLIGGGRIPISSAIPDVSQLKKLADKEVDKAKKRDILLREIGGKAGAYLALPFGGGQIKKIAEAADIMHKGGSYTMNDKGERQLQFLADQTPKDAVKAATFGKYSLPQGQRYIRDGFNKLSVKQTQVVDEARKRGMDPQAVVDLLGNLKGIKALKDEDGKTIKGEAAQKREVIAQSDFSAEDKNWLDSQLINDGFFLPKEVEADYSSEAALGISDYGTKVQEKAGSAKKAGIDEETFLAAYEAQRGKESDKGKDGQTILLSKDKKRKAAVDEATPDLSRYKRQKLYEILGISKQVW